MCGITGLWSTHEREAEALRSSVDRMAGTLRHRGDDDSGTWVDHLSGLALGHTRLSIIDLSSRAKQPMAGPAGRAHIVFNGEIYNYIEKRHELEAKGVQLATRSDTEVLLGLYEQHGLECLPLLRGMFAFALWDQPSRRLLLARDRIGKKPLYYCFFGGCLYFASEIKAIVSALPGPPAFDPGALDEYLSFGFVSGARTIYREVRELPPGAVLVAASPDDTKIHQYWEPRWAPKRAVSFSEAVEEIDEGLTEAVRLRLRADVPVGIFLSGGIDSGLITAIASKSSGQSYPTFSVGFGDEAFDERRLARQVARRYQTDHHEVVLKPDVASLIPKIAWHHDEPFADASAIPSFAISEYARQHVKTVLNGDGGDELFAGYRRHLAVAVLAKIKQVMPERALRHIAKATLHLLPSPKSFRSPYAFSHRFLRGLSQNGAEGILAWSFDGFTAEERSELYQQPPPAPDSALGALEGIVDALGSLGELDRALALGLVWELPGVLLVKMDIATMAYGLEARSPFLDQELIGWANRLPEAVRLGGYTTKPLLRALAKRYLPEVVVCAPKRGFEVPLYRWLTEDLREMRDDLILARDGLVSSLFRRSRLEHLLLDSVDNPSRWARKVWILFMLAAWDRYCHRATIQDTSSNVLGASDL